MYFATFKNNGERITTYVQGINANIPSDAIQITAEEQQLYATNGYIRDMTTGKPVPKPVYVPTIEELLVGIRAQRNRLLSECDWTQLPDVQLTTEQIQQWRAYRQTLRDFPETCNPVNPVWPVVPV